MRDDEMLDKRFLRQPRGTGTGWTFKMDTPPRLVGAINPRTGRPYGRTIHEGLETRDVREACRKRDLLLGHVREEERRAGSDYRLSEEAAVEWAKARAEGLIRPLVVEHIHPQTGEVIQAEETIEDDLIMEQAERVGEARGREAGRRWYGLASGKAALFGDAMERYAQEREDLTRSTRNNLGTEGRRFMQFAGDGITLHEVSRSLAHQYLNDYLRSLKTAKAPDGLQKATIQRAKTLLCGLWDWARRTGVLPYESVNPWRDQKITIAERRPTSGAVTGVEGIFTPEQWRSLMATVSAGDPLGDALRIAIATGCRLNEIAARTIDDVTPDRQAIFIPWGKSKNARRYVPLFGEAQLIVERRCAGGGVLFPELEVRPSSGARGGQVSQRFTRVRRKVLGEDTDGKLNFHSTRHTWRTIARRTDVPDRTVQELGGWARLDSSDRPYDHGLDEERYRKAARKIYETLVAEGYLVEA